MLRPVRSSALLAFFLLAGCSSGSGDDTAAGGSATGGAGGQAMAGTGGSGGGDHGGESAAGTGGGGHAGSGAQGGAGDGGAAGQGGVGGSSGGSGAPGMGGSSGIGGSSGSGGGAGVGGNTGAIGDVASWCDPSHASAAAKQDFCSSGWCWEAPLPATASGPAWASDDAGVWIADNGYALQVKDGVVTPLALLDGVFPEAIGGFGDQVWIVGVDAAVQYHLVRIQNGAFTEVPLPTGFNPGSIPSMAVAGPDDVWLAGENGLTHVDANGASTQPSPLGGGVTMSAVGAEVWVISGAGNLFHISGGALSPVSLVGSDTPMMVAVRGADDVFLGTTSGITHFDGKTWKALPPTDGLYPIHLRVTAGGSLVASDLSLGLTVFDGAFWSPVAAPAGVSFALDAFFVKGQAFYQSVAGWPLAQASGDKLTSPFGLSGITASLAGYAWNDIWAGAYGGVMHFDGTSWSFTGLPSGMSLASTSVFRGVSAKDVWAFSGGAMFHYDGSSWKTAPSLPAPYVADLSAFSETDVWALAGGLFHYDGVTWTPVPTQMPNVTPYVVAALGPNDVIVGSDDGFERVGAHPYWENGLSFDRFLLLPGGDLWAAASGRLQHWNGKGFDEIPGTTDVFSLAGCSTEDIWTGGMNHAGHLDATGWHAGPAPTEGALGQLFTSGGGNVISAYRGLLRRQM